jgi:hypothetical protein
MKKTPWCRSAAGLGYHWDPAIGDEKHAVIISQQMGFGQNQQTGVLSKHLGTSRQTDPNSMGFLFSTEASGITWVVGYSDSSFRQRWKRETKGYLLGSSILGGSTPTPVLMNTVCSHAETCTHQPAIYLHISAAKRPNSKAMWTLLNSWNMDFTPPQKKKNISWPAEMVRIWQLPTGWGPRVS